MDQSIYTGLINNTALLLVLVVLYDVFILRWQPKRTYPQKIVTGLLVGTICIGLMLNPWQLAPGVFFDTRSVLLSISGLYIGTIPAITAAVVAALFRVFQGGSGMHMGVLVIITTMLIGLIWRNMRRGKKNNPRWIDLYVFGLIVHVDMLVCTLALPSDSRQMIFDAIAVPVLVVYPIATTMLGLIMNTWNERQKLDERLRESDARWQMAVESADAGIWDLDIPSMKVSFSRQGRALLGYRPFETEMTYQEWLAHIHPDDRQRADTEMQAVLEEKIPQFISERRVRRADGSYQWVMTRGRISGRDEAGKPLRMSGITADISARKQAEEERERLFEIIDASPTEVFVFDAERMTLEYASAGALRNLGYSREALFNLSPFQIAPEFDEESFAALLAPLKRGQIGQMDITSEFIRANGTRYPVDIHIRVFSRKDSTLLIAIAQDITIRKQNELALFNSEKQFRLLFSEMASGSAVHEMLYDNQGRPIDYRFLAVNEAFENLTGLVAEEIIGKTVKQVIPGIDPHWIERYGRVAQTGEPVTFEEYFEPFMKYYDVHAYSTEKNKFAVIFQDITERKRIEIELKNLNTELEERVRLRTAELQSANLELEAFSYSVSHDLRAPLRAIDGFVTILDDEYASKLDDEARRLIGVVRSNAQTMGNLIEDLLRYSRATRADMVMEEVDVAGLARSVFHELTSDADRRRLKFQVSRIPRLRGDPTMLRQVMMNLISNALKFTSKVNTPSIRVSGRRQNGEVVICVQDNGAGFDMRYIDKVFNVFQRLHSSAEFEGSGVGLAIVKRIITRHGGRVWAEGEVGKGARFYFALPDFGKE